MWVPRVCLTQQTLTIFVIDAVFPCWLTCGAASVLAERAGGTAALKAASAQDGGERERIGKVRCAVKGVYNGRDGSES